MNEEELRRTLIVKKLEDIKTEIVKEIIEPNDIDCFDESNICQKWFLNLLDKHFNKYIKENKQ